jgi:serine protease inhibitor
MPNTLSDFLPNAFALNLLEAIAEENKTENIFVSPLSIFLATMMLERGASGTTQAGIRRALGFSEDVSDMDIANLLYILRPYLQNSNPALSIANALWIDENTPLFPEFIEECRSLLHSSVFSVGGGAEEIAQRINVWIEKQTKGQISNMVSPQSVQPPVRAVLTNAVYFKEDWRSPFEAYLTRNGTFYLEGKQEKNIPFMHKMLTSAYIMGDGYQGVQLNYKNPKIRFYALLPDVLCAPRELLAKLAQSSFAIEEGSEVDLALPHIQMDFSIELPSVLGKMGMNSAFDETQANFSRMTTRQPQYINSVHHYVHLEVNEIGTLATAATSYDMLMGAAALLKPPYKLIFDHPFVILIVDVDGAILFSGIVYDPMPSSAGTIEHLREDTGINLLPHS